MTDTTTSRRSTTTETPSGPAETVRQVADTVAGAAGEVAARVPEVAQGTREVITEANRLVHRGSDETLRVVGAASLGFAFGLLIGGAPRVLVLGALFPAGLVGATLVERADGTTRPTKSTAR